MVQSASGMVGDTVVFRTVRGKLQMANVPGKRTGKPSQKQAAVQRKFQEAAQYAKRPNFISISIGNSYPVSHILVCAEKLISLPFSNWLN